MNALCRAAVCAAALLTGCSQSSTDGNTFQKINGTVRVAAGTPAAAAETVNGAIDLDDGAAVTTANTVNGNVHVGAHAKAESLSTVNGGITLEVGAEVNKSAETVNGSLTLREGATVMGAIANVNGKIEVIGARVGGGIKTVNGNISITGASVVDNGVRVQKIPTQLISFGNDVPRIVIGPGATVNGELRFERPVHLYISDHATIGTVSGATAIPFSGETPPSG